ncbi:MAG: hypothetical protein ACLP1Q_09095 [Solirubrobacteraceae bacterium]
MRDKRESGVTDIHSIALTEKQEREAVELAQRLLLTDGDAAPQP